MAALGHKPSSYLRFFERLLCDVKQTLSLFPGERLSTASTSHSSSLSIRASLRKSVVDHVAVVIKETTSVHEIAIFVTHEIARDFLVLDAF